MKCNVGTFIGAPHYLSSSINSSVDLRRNTVNSTPATNYADFRHFDFVALWAVHMKWIPFYCNSAHELKGAGMKTKCIWVGFRPNSLWSTFCRCPMRSMWVARKVSYPYLISVYTLFSKSRVTNHCISHPASKFRQSGDQRCHVNRIPDVPPKREIQGLCESQHAFSSSYFRCLSTVMSFTLRVEGFGKSRGTTYKLGHITCSKPFSFRSSAFRFVSSVKVKRSFHVYTVYWTFHTSFII
jgi:hypothetical protein